MHSENRKKSIVTGSIVILFGVLWLLDEARLIPFYIWNEVIISWQMLLIAIGVISLSSAKNRTAGFVLITVGVIFMILKFWDLNNEVLFALGLIAIGGFIIYTAFNKNKSDHRRYFPQNKGDTSYFEISNVFSGTNRTINSNNLKAGKVTSIFGGSEINLTQVSSPEEEITIEIFTLFGGTSLIIPPDWEVVVDVQPVFGGIDDKRRTYQPATGEVGKRLVIFGTVIFGGGDIKSI